MGRLEKKARKEAARGSSDLNRPQLSAASGCVASGAPAPIAHLRSWTAVLDCGVGLRCWTAVLDSGEGQWRSTGEINGGNEQRLRAAAPSAT